MPESRTLARRSYTEVPESYESRPPTLAMAMIDAFDAEISIDVGESEDPFASISAADSRAGEGRNERERFQLRRAARRNDAHGRRQARDHQRHHSLIEALYRITRLRQYIRHMGAPSPGGSFELPVLA